MEMKTNRGMFECACTVSLEDVAPPPPDPRHVLKAEQCGIHTQACATLPDTTDITRTHTRHQWDCDQQKTHVFPLVIFPKTENLKKVTASPLTDTSDSFRKILHQIYKTSYQRLLVSAVRERYYRNDHTFWPIRMENLSGVLSWACENGIITSV